MNTDEIKQQIFNGLIDIAPEVELDELDPNENLREELDIDSYDFLSLLIGLNESLGVEIPETDYEKLVSLTDLVAYLAAKLDESR
ncbi:acyl carrier protein [Malonomonas rubra DSM 5091]|uniref:Acyl carrier protein n=1 Tax=Malonomonas rubra DSM 5091 TaxID=1122189 RepID=A0A1M6LND0_MALRU|nr:phosphopantetheine-binding protein [Malonomonas rubra]SHJ72665.1 acyl carrier protein [Malonomonas rubra DSM 5091]